MTASSKPPTRSGARDEGMCKQVGHILLRHFTGVIAAKDLLMRQRSRFAAVQEKVSRTLGPLRQRHGALHAECVHQMLVRLAQGSLHPERRQMLVQWIDDEWAELNARQECTPQQVYTLRVRFLAHAPGARAGLEQGAPWDGVYTPSLATQPPGEDALVVLDGAARHMLTPLYQALLAQMPLRKREAFTDAWHKGDALAVLSQAGKVNPAAWVPLDESIFQLQAWCAACVMSLERQRARERDMLHQTLQRYVGVAGATLRRREVVQLREDITERERLLARFATWMTRADEHMPLAIGRDGQRATG